MPHRHHTPAKGISRRTVLRGAGVTMALPWLESMNVWGARRGRLSQALRRAVHGQRRQRGSLGLAGLRRRDEAQQDAEPLEPLKHKINVIHGLFHKRATGNGIHPAQTGGLLSGAVIQKGAIVKAGITVDQMLANRIGQDTALPSIVLACEQPMTGFHETNYSLAYSSHLSWQSAGFAGAERTVSVAGLGQPVREPRQPAAPQHSRPREGRGGRARPKSISSGDKAKLDEYLTSLREVEKRVETMRKAKDTADDRAKEKNRPAFTMARPANGLPEDLREHARLMCDIIAIAFQTDKTRIATLLLARDLGALYYPFLNVADGHHAASHDNNSAGYERIASFHLSQLAYLATKLDSMPEGDGTVLDNSCLMWLSNMWIGRKHDNTRLPLVLAGGLGGTLKTGRTLNYVDAGDENRKMSSLFLSLMDRMGVKLDQFGDATERLVDL